MTANLDLEDHRLALGAVQGTGCIADEAIALSAFFELSSYRRADSNSHSNAAQRGKK